MVTGYLNTPVYKHHWVQVDDVHTLSVEECGNPNGVPVVFLHGGPGGNVSEFSRRPFDPDYYRIILVDQRGCGQSRPFLSIVDNTPLHSVADLEVIRQQLGIESWYVFGGSYGSTLALLYAIHHPARCKGLILRGIFLGRREDSQWLFQFGASEFYPEQFAQFKSLIPATEQADLVQSYYRLMLSEDATVREAAYRGWSSWEEAVIRLLPEFLDKEAPLAPYQQTIALFEAHYFANDMFWGDDNYILKHAAQLCDIPMWIYHGRYDVDCRPSGAYELAKACPHAELTIIEAAGHSITEPPIFEALWQRMEQLKQLN